MGKTHTVLWWAILCLCLTGLGNDAKADKAGPELDNGSRTYPREGQPRPMAPDPGEAARLWANGKRLDEERARLLRKEAELKEWQGKIATAKQTANALWADNERFGKTPVSSLEELATARAQYLNRKAEIEGYVARINSNEVELNQVGGAYNRDLSTFSTESYWHAQGVNNYNRPASQKPLFESMPKPKPQPPRSMDELARPLPSHPKRPDGRRHHPGR
jgi:hypothetical protein